MIISRFAVIFPLRLSVSGFALPLRLSSNGTLDHTTLIRRYRRGKANPETLRRRGKITAKREIIMY